MYTLYMEDNLASLTFFFKCEQKNYETFQTERIVQKIM